MLDNENTNDSSTSDAVSQESSSDSSSTDQQTNSAPASAEGGEQSADKTSNTPFHEHPRWKEMVEQRNAASKRAEDLERKYSDIAKRLEDREKREQATSQPQKADDLLAEMKKINPVFAERFEKLEAQLKRVEEFDNRFKQMDTRDMNTRVQSSIQSLLTENKVPQNLHKRYENDIRAIAALNPKLTVNDLPGVFKSVHDDFTSLLDGIKRAERAGYVQDKKADSKVPASVSSGKAVNPSKETKFSRDPDEARREMRAAVLADLKSGKVS